MTGQPTRRPLWRTLLNEAGIDLWAATIGVLVNGVLGHDLVPRPVRWLGYRALGTRILTPNVFPGLRMFGPLHGIEIGKGTFVNRECYIEAVAPVRIGQECQVGPQVMVVTSHHPRTPDGGVTRQPEGRAVSIGDRVWLGARALVLPGVTIADDVVIAAGAVVARDCLEPGVYAGVPARLVSRGGSGHSRADAVPHQEGLERRGGQQ